MKNKIDKLVLIIPPSPWLLSDRDIPMMGILYIAEYVKHRCEVVVCDLSGLEEKDWYIPVGDMYGVTGVSPQFVYMQRIIDILKDREPDKPVIAGGVHATVASQHLLDNTQVDACVVGEGERAMLNLVSGYDWDKVPGVITRKSNAGSAHLVVDIDFLEPDRKAIDYYSYLEPRTFGYMADVKREGSIITGRGCPFACSFCASKKMHAGKVRFKGAEFVVNELLYLQDEFGVEMVNILDDTFILDKKRVYKICRLLRGKGLKWFCLTRADCIDRDLLLEMKTAGCLSVGIGFETGSDRLLKLMNKKIAIAQARECVKIVSLTGLLINGQLIVGFPTETDEDVHLTERFIKDNPEVDTFGLHMFQPFPGTDVWEHSEKYGIEIDKNTDFADFHTIGRHDGKYHKDPVLDARYRYLKSIVGDRSRELRICKNTVYHKNVKDGLEPNGKCGCQK
uniref:Putative radical SAM superfamily protein n=1 Tax=viral metagenome TaxID=1070528 RepID=A0A6M3ISM9_9ZZZZ